MSATHLPNQVAPLRLARDRVTMAGTLPASRFQRFLQSVERVEGDIHAELDFRLDEEQRICVSGTLRVDVELVCQRCLQGFVQPLRCDLHLALVRSEAELETLPAAYEAVQVEREPVALVDLLEDDLILALPTVPQHAEGEAACRVPESREGGGKSSAQDAGDAPDGERENPFAVLRRLKD